MRLPVAVDRQSELAGQYAHHRVLPASERKALTDGRRIPLKASLEVRIGQNSDGIRARAVILGPEQASRPRASAE